MIYIYGGKCSCFATLLLVLLLNAAVSGLAGIQPPLPPLSASLTSAITTAVLNPDNISHDVQEIARKAMSYFDSSTDPFHAVQSSIDLLTASGFVELSNDNDSTAKIQAGGKYYYTRNRSTLVAFAVGDQCCSTTTTTASSKSSNHDWGIKIIGGHTDSPNLRVKPRSQQQQSSSPSVGTCIQIGVECYGGGLWHTWFDRDLGISGRVMIRHRPTGMNDPDDNNKMVTITQPLVRIDRPILRISNLAIHLQSEDERKAFKYNKEEHLSPILAMAVQSALDRKSVV